MKKHSGKKYADLVGEITSQHLYQNRRQFMKMAILALGGTLVWACSPKVRKLPKTSQTADEYGNPLTPEKTANNYNTFVEFTLSKDNVQQAASSFHTSPWTIEVSGLVDRPETHSLDDILKLFTQEDRIYRMRCVECFSMVIPWQGFSLSQILARAKPTNAARFVKITSVFRPDEMPGQKSMYGPWPYHDGLRLDEAMHDLTILATGIYGKPLPIQDGAPIRLVVPWKYGFKSVKSITKIELVTDQPTTSYSSMFPNDVGFYSNVNPNRLNAFGPSGTEQRLGEDHTRPTLIYNGYADEVASLYTGLE